MVTPTPAEECRRQYARLMPLYREAILDGNFIRAGNIARRMDAIRKVAWAIKCIDERARARGTEAVDGLTFPYADQKPVLNKRRPDLEAA